MIFFASSPKFSIFIGFMQKLGNICLKSVIQDACNTNFCENNNYIEITA